MHEAHIHPGSVVMVCGTTTLLGAEGPKGAGEPWPGGTGELGGEGGPHGGGCRSSGGWSNPWLLRGVSVYAARRELGSQPA